MFSDGVEPVTEQTLAVRVVLEVLGPGDVVVVGFDHQLLAGHVVGAGEGDPLLALVVDRVRRDDESTSPSSISCSRMSEVRLLPLDVVLGDAQRAGDDLGDLDVEALGLALEALQAEAGLVELGADGDVPGLGELGHGGAGLELGFVGDLDVAAAVVVAAAGGQRERQRRGQRSRPWSA